LDADGFVGQTIEIAGDEIAGVKPQDSLSRAASKPITYRRFPDSLLQENAFSVGLQICSTMADLRGM
jgi:hypothetical protein